jgi:hypothetical protein
VTTAIFIEFWKNHLLQPLQFFGLGRVGKLLLVEFFLNVLSFCIAKKKVPKKTLAAHTAVTSRDLRAAAN